MKEIKIIFKTITPIFTGDAWGENTRIRPSSIMGSLRFWFEVICYFTGMTNDNDYENGKLKADLTVEEFKKKLSTNGANYEGIDKTLAENGIPLPARVFGCTSWKGWIRIKKSRPIEDYCFGNRLNLPYAININGKKWYLKQPYFYGKFEVIFEIEDHIIKPLFYPLLTFMKKYGFWGGGCNTGYGRLKIESMKTKNNKNWEEITDWRKEEFGFSGFYKNIEGQYQNKKFSNFIKATSNFPDLENRNTKILYKFENQISSNNFSDIIKELLKTKAEHRRYISNKIERHNIFGTAGQNSQGTKIIPWIYEEGGQLKGGFISIAGILNLG